MEQRYLCELCGGTGRLQGGEWNPLSNKYDGDPGLCDHCEGKGCLGEDKSSGKIVEHDGRYYAVCEIAMLERRPQFVIRTEQS